MGSDGSLSVEGFRATLRNELTEICRDRGGNFDSSQDRGFAFQIWAADLLLQNHEIDADGQDYVFTTRDLKIDIAFDEEETKTLCLGQTKCESISSNPDIKETEVNDFFQRHGILLDDVDWVRSHASDDLHDLICDYGQRLNEGWNINFYFVSTGTASRRVKELVAAEEDRVKKKFPNVNFILYDFYDLKEQYIRSRSVEETIAKYVDVQFSRDSVLEKTTPHRTLMAIVKGNTLVGLYKKERERLFAYNIRSFLGKRVNKAVVETAARNPSEFFYFNNGVSAICTDIEDLGKNKFRFHSFQVINGAQTVGSLAAVPNLSPDCEVILRITQGASVKTEKGFNADVIRFNNTQNVVRASDFRSNDRIQLWIEEQFNRLKARGAVSSPLRYVRKRSFKRVRGADAIKLEELAKIRFAFLVEPTRCIADPRSLWTGEEDGGFYEQAFGMKGKLVDIWDEVNFKQAVFATVTYLSIMDRITKLVKQDKAKYSFLRRLRYWALNLSALHIQCKKLDMFALLESRAAFDSWFDKFWKDIFRDLVAAHQSALSDKISNFALTRNEGRWKQTRGTLELVLSADDS
jgi:hypothetical protein